MDKTVHYNQVLQYFAEAMPTAETELVYNNPFELLVSVILSAQCTDKRVNSITPALFNDFPTPVELAAATFDVLFPYIKSISYPNNKTRHLLSMAKTLIDEFDGEVPDTVEKLQKLQGVGRKTANVIASVVYNQPTMAVDTHVFRVAKRLGLVAEEARTPLEVERTLMQYIPLEQVPKAHHWLILHGRYTCVARKPKCASCGLFELCSSKDKRLDGAI